MLDLLDHIRIARFLCGSGAYYCCQQPWYLTYFKHRLRSMMLLLMTTFQYCVFCWVNPRMSQMGVPKIYSLHLQHCISSLRVMASPLFKTNFWPLVNFFYIQIYLWIRIMPKTNPLHLVPIHPLLWVKVAEWLACTMT